MLALVSALMLGQALPPGALPLGSEGQCMRFTTTGDHATISWDACAVLGSGAPTTATYLTQTCDAALLAEQCMSALGTGLVLSTTGTGVQSIYAGSSCGANQWASSTSASGALTCSQPPFSSISGSVTDSQVPNNITVDLAATANALASDPTDCAGGQFATGIAASGNLTCSTPAGGGYPSATLANDVTCAVSASYCTVFSYTPGASKKIVLTAWLVVNSASTTVAPQFRVSSADTGYTGRCTWAAYSAAVATTTAPVYDNIAIGAAPADTADTAWGSTADQPVTVLCNLVSDASPGAILIEWQLETGTSPTQTIRAGSYYVAVTS